MLGELDVLKIISERLETAGVAFMLTGSFAMAYYGQPRMTRDLDLIVALTEVEVDPVVAVRTIKSTLIPDVWRVSAAGVFPSAPCRPGLNRYLDRES